MLPKGIPGNEGFRPYDADREAVSTASSGARRPHRLLPHPGDDPGLSIDEEEVEQARQEREEAALARAAALTDLDSAVASYEALNAELEELTFRVGRLRSQIDLYEGQTRDLRQVIRDRAVDSYMHGDERGTLASVFNPRLRSNRSSPGRYWLSPSTPIPRHSTPWWRRRMRWSGSKRTCVWTATASPNSEVEADAIVVRMNELFATAAAEFTQADTDFVAASAALAEQRRIEEEERQRREAEQRQRDAIRAALGAPSEGVPMSLTPGVICPIAAPTFFTNSWGHPVRVGGSTRGPTCSPRCAPLVAVADGVVRLSFSSLGGTVIHLLADHGVDYFYAHLDGYAPGLVDGQRVERGQVIGYNGDTGNAAPGAWHLHFGMRPGGITQVNPYPTVRAVCPDPAHASSTLHLVTETKRRRIDQIQDATFLGGLGKLPLDDLRSRRSMCDDLDIELSYYRRMLHGRMDLLAFEMRRSRAKSSRPCSRRCLASCPRAPTPPIPVCPVAPCLSRFPISRHRVGVSSIVLSRATSSRVCRDSATTICGRPTPFSSMSRSTSRLSERSFMPRSIGSRRS